MLLSNNALTFLGLLLFVVIAACFKMSVNFTETSEKYINGNVIKPNIQIYHQTIAVLFGFLLVCLEHGPLGISNYRIGMTYLCLWTFLETLNDLIKSDVLCYKFLQ